MITEYLEKWAEICFLLSDNVHQNIAEKEFESQVVRAMEVLGSEPVNNFWTLIVKNYCSIFLSPNASAGGLIHAAPGKAGGNGTPLTNRSG